MTKIILAGALLFALAWGFTTWDQDRSSKRLAKSEASSAAHQVWLDKREVEVVTHMVNGREITQLLIPVETELKYMSNFKRCYLIEQAPMGCDTDLVGRFLSPS